MSAPHTTERAVFATFAELFAYPRGDLAGAARRCLALLERGHPSIPGLRKFLAAASELTLGEMEELYSTTFDLQPCCAPYVGWQLCPDPARRNMFLSALSAVYSGEDFRPQEELADHLSEVLRFLAVARDPEARLTLLREGLTPAVARMASSFTPPSNPYLSLLEALRAYLARPARRRAAGREETRP
jgi:nitrate reductase delta subunit